jgi:hypothetical protein
MSLSSASTRYSDNSSSSLSSQATSVSAAPSWRSQSKLQNRPPLLTDGGAAQQLPKNVKSECYFLVSVQTLLSSIVSYDRCALGT